MRMIQNSALASGVALALVGLHASALPIYAQNFDISAAVPPVAGCNVGNFPGGPGTYPFPAGWLLRNVDNRTPDTSVSYVNAAWIVREDFGTDVTNCVAFSTSYYAPAGQADDWMWTPAIVLPAGTSILSWRARTYDAAYQDGYEVRVMAAPNVPTGGTGVIGNQLSASMQVFSVAAEVSSWVTHTVDLSAYSGQTIQVGFRNNSNDKFLLVVDDVTVFDATPDLSAVSASAPAYSGEYSRAPDGFMVAATLGLNASNTGGAGLTNIVGTATLQNAGVDVGSAYVSTSLASLSIGASAPLSFTGPAIFAGSGTWSVHYHLNSDQDASEENTVNNVLDIPGPNTGGNEFARDEGPFTGQLGIGAGNGGELGVAFTLRAETNVGGVRFSMASQSPTNDDGMGGTTPNPWAGLPLIANLRAFDTGTGKPGALIDTTLAVTSTFDGGVYDAAFSAGPHALAAGTYVVTVSEPPEATMSLTMYTTRFTPGTAWVNWPTSPYGGWANIEQFGAGFAKTPGVSLLTEVSIFKDGFDVAVASRPSTASRHAWRNVPPQAAHAPTRKPVPTQLVAPM